MYQMHSARREQGEKWLTQQVDARGSAGEVEDLVRDGAWRDAPLHGFQRGDVVEFTQQELRRGRRYQRQGFYVGSDAAGQAAVRLGSEIEVYVLIDHAQLTRLYRPTRLLDRVQDTLPTVLSFQPDQARRVQWVEDVRLPHRRGEAYLNRRGVGFTVVGTDLHTGGLILQADGFELYASLLPGELGHLTRAEAAPTH